MAGEVAITGTVTVISTTPTDQGGSIHFDSLGEGERDARAGISNDAEGYQEVNRILSELSQNYAFPSGNAARVWLMQMLQSMGEQPLDGSDRVYEQ
jgi:hypothetical protein